MSETTTREAYAADLADPASSPKPGIMATRDLANLNLLRTVGVGLVFVGHLTATMRVRALGDLGHFGVLLFFVHTALVLMFSMERLALSGTGLYASFVIRRIFRIYPLSVLTVLLVVVLRVPSTSWGTGFVWPGWPGLLSNILLTQNITHSGSVDCVLCSLPFEVQMYAVLPLLYILIQCFTSLRSTLLIWLVTAAIAGLEYWLRGPAFDSDFLLLRYFPCFLAGVFAWRLLATRGGGGRTSRLALGACSHGSRLLLSSGRCFASLWPWSR